ncbi:GNAT family N-acetyltransferase [Paucibacter soli]|uniref:GNAT family N-acetyltransferase n=1 Tax=Paucibacter soli TaxID=3133433 RepID=UPI0030A439A4
MEVLRTERLRLRWFTLDDAPQLLALLNEPGWISNISDPGVRDLAQARDWMQSRLLDHYWKLGHGFWALERLADGEFLGLCGVFKRDALEHPDVGYALLERHQGQGYAREAAAASLRYAHEVLGLDCVQAIIAPHNQASARVLLAIGMQEQGQRQVAGYDGGSLLFEWRAASGAADDDAAQIDALAARFLGAFANRDGRCPTLAALPYWMLPDAQIRCQDGQQGAQLMDVQGFVLPRAELLREGGRLQDFAEWELVHETRIHGRIAQRWLRYEKAGRLDGAPYAGRGQKSLQLLKTARGWRIAAVLWQDEAA